jgi:hypothetical protein
MPVVDRLSEGVRVLHKSAVGLLPATGLGVVRKDGPEHVVLTYVDGFGITAYRTRERDVPEAFASPKRVGARPHFANAPPTSSCWTGC